MEKPRSSPALRAASAAPRPGARQGRRRVIVHYGSGAKEAEAVVAEIRAAGGQADAIAADLGAPDGAHKLAAEVRKLVGERSIFSSPMPALRGRDHRGHDGRGVRSSFAVNVRAPFFLVQQLLPIWAKAPASCCSPRSRRGPSVGLLPAYAATKGAIDTLVKHFAAATRPPRYPRQRGRARRDRNRHVEIRQNRCRPRIRAGHAGVAAARRPDDIGDVVRSSHRMTHAGSPARRSMSTAARSSKPASEISDRTAVPVDGHSLTLKGDSRCSRTRRQDRTRHRRLARHWRRDCQTPGRRRSQGGDHLYRGADAAASVVGPLRRPAEKRSRSRPMQPMLAP